MQKRWIWPFELEEQIGKGAMGVVYKARFVKNDRRVALKLLPEDLAANPTLTARFERELDILKDLRHPSIVHCFGGTCEGAQLFYAMELVEGGTVESLLKERGKLPWERVIEYGLQICSALSYAHAQGIVHRDIKPANLLLTKADKIKLGDFGLALVAAGDKLTSEHKTLGTLLYMAPEQIRGSPALSNRTDLYAFGCVLFEMLTGEPPFHGDSAGQILNQHLQQAPPRVAAVALDCPPELDSIVFDLMQKDPERRPEDAAAVARRMQAVHETIVVRTPPNKINLEGELARTRVAIAPENGGDTAGAAAKSRETAVRRVLISTVVLLLLLTGWMWLQSIGHRGLDPKAEALWLAGLHDSEPSVRLFVARSLGELGPDTHAAVPALIESLKDPDRKVREQVLVSLGKLGSAARPAVPAIMSVQKRDEILSVRLEAERALEQIQAAPSGSRRTVYLGVSAAAVLIIGIVWRWRRQAAA